MKKVSLIMALLILMTLLPGCTTDSKEIDEQVYSLIIGCDKGIDNKIRLTIQFPTYKGGGGGGGMQKGGGGEEKESGVVDGTIVQTVESSSILEGINLMNTATTRRISLVHTKAIVFSEELAKEGISSFLEPIARFRETRRIMQVIVCRGTAQDFIKENKTAIGESVAKAMELASLQSDNTGFFPSTPFQEFYTATISVYRQPYAIYAGLNTFNNLKPLDHQDSSPLKPQYELLPGKIPREGDRKIEMIGTAVFNGDRMVGNLNSYETRYFMMIIGDFARGIVTIEDKESPQRAIPLDLRLARRPKIKAYFDNGTPVIEIRLSVEADLGAIQSRINYEKLNKIDELNKQIEDTVYKGVVSVIKKVQTEWNVDIFGFGKKIAHSFFTTTEFEQYNWLSHFKEARVNVEVEASVRRTGLMMESSPVRYNNKAVLSGGEKK